MAIFNEILSGRFNRALQKLTGIKGGPPVRQLGSEILPIFPLFWGAEMRYLESWNRFGIADQQNAVAAQNSVMQLRNPAGSNVLLVVEKLTFTNPGGATLQLNINLGGQPTNLATNDSAFTTRLDARTQTTNANGIFSRANNVVVTGFTFYTVQVPAGSTVDMILTDDQEITILPGDALQVQTAVNVQLNLSMVWRERFLEDSERA